MRAAHRPRRQGEVKGARLPPARHGGRAKRGCAGGCRGGEASAGGRGGAHPPTGTPRGEAVLPSRAVGRTERRRRRQRRRSRRAAAAGDGRCSRREGRRQAARRGGGQADAAPTLAHAAAAAHLPAALPAGGSAGAARGRAGALAGSASRRAGRGGRQGPGPAHRGPPAAPRAPSASSACSARAVCPALTPQRKRLGLGFPRAASRRLPPCCCGLAPRIAECFPLEQPFKTIEPSRALTLPRLVPNRVRQHRISASFRHLRGRCLHRLLGQPVSMSDHSCS